MCFVISAFYKLKIHASLCLFYVLSQWVCVYVELNLLCLRSFKIEMINFRYATISPLALNQWIQPQMMALLMERIAMYLYEYQSSMCSILWSHRPDGVYACVCVCMNIHECQQLNRKLNEAKINWVKTRTRHITTQKQQNNMLPSVIEGLGDGTRTREPRICAIHDFGQSSIINLIDSVIRYVEVYNAHNIL